MVVILNRLARVVAAGADAAAGGRRESLQRRRGLGHYPVDDDRNGENLVDAARALTGWTVRDDAFRERVTDHDDGEKTILGRRGRWRGDDLLRMLLEQPATPERLAIRLCGEFFGEVAATDRSAHDKAVRELADGLRRSDAVRVRREMESWSTAARDNALLGRTAVTP